MQIFQQTDDWKTKHYIKLSFGWEAGDESWSLEVRGWGYERYVWGEVLREIWRCLRGCRTGCGCWGETVQVCVEIFRCWEEKKEVDLVSVLNKASRMKMCYFVFVCWDGEVVGCRGDRRDSQRRREIARLARAQSDGGIGAQIAGLSADLDEQ